MVNWSRSQLSFSRRRNEALASSYQRKLRRVLGSPERVPTPSDYVGHLSFARESHRLAYVNATFSSNLCKVVFDPLTERVLDDPKEITDPTKQASRPAISPDGAWLAFNSARVEEDLFVMRADGIDLRQLTHEGHRDLGPRWSPNGQHLASFPNARETGKSGRQA